MHLRDRWRNLWQRPQELTPARSLDLLTGFNVRELGGYAVGDGETRYRRFLRSGGLDTLSAQDQQRLHDYGVRLVVDLRGNHEVEMARDRLAEMSDVRFLHVPLYDFDLSDPKLRRPDDDEGYLTAGYLTMLANRDAVGRIFSFFATAAPDECVLFHCAAGMDRTGVTAMLLLGLVGASEQRIVADYCYSFSSVAEVDRMVFGGEKVRDELRGRYASATSVVRSLLDGYGSFEKYLLACGVTAGEIASIRAHLCG